MGYDKLEELADIHLVTSTWLRKRGDEKVFNEQCGRKTR
jgi:hypothetical protein